MESCGSLLGNQKRWNGEALLGQWEKDLSDLYRTANITSKGKKKTCGLEVTLRSSLMATC